MLDTTAVTSKSRGEVASSSSWEWVTGWGHLLGYAQRIVLPQPTIALWLVVPASLGLAWLLWRRS
jgi:hypothetical protein